MKAFVLLTTVVMSLASAQETAHVNVPGAGPGYILGAGDQFSMEIADLEELNGKVHRIDNDGTVSLPLVGRMQAAGLTIPEFEKQLDDKLTSQLKDPHITITVTETLSQPVSVIGAVNTPGIHQIRGQQSLRGVISGWRSACRCGLPGSDHSPGELWRPSPSEFEARPCEPNGHRGSKLIGHYGSS